MFLFVGSLSSQNKIFIGEKSYPCSETFTFSDRTDLYIQFIKDKDVGMITLTIRTISCESRISGKILIYLDNETVITCLDRNKYDCVNGMATTIYYLTKEEINKLKNSNINAIRYSIGNSWGKEDFKAYNKSYRSNSSKNVPYIVRQLFN